MLAMFIVDQPVLHPGCCYLCGRGTGQMVDTHKEEPDHGHVYVCVESCVDVLARLAGWTSPGEVTDVLDEVESLEAKVAGLEAELAAAVEDRVVSLKDVRKLVAGRSTGGGQAA